MAGLPQAPHVISRNDGKLIEHVQRNERRVTILEPGGDILEQVREALARDHD